MRGLRSFLAGLNAFVSASLLLDLVRWPTRLIHLPVHAGDGRWFLAIVAWLFLPGIVVVYGASAISYWRRWRSARIWALAASSISFATPFFLAWALAHYGNASTPMILQWFQFTSLLLIIGALGYIAFWNWDPSIGESAGHCPSANPRRRHESRTQCARLGIGGSRLFRRDGSVGSMGGRCGPACSRWITDIRCHYCSGTADGADS